MERIERTLAADEMMGRKAFTPAADKAADFIAAEFKKAGLQTLNGSTGFRQDFVMVRTKFISVLVILMEKYLKQKISLPLPVSLN